MPGIGVRRHSGDRPLACVLGGMDLVTPLGRAGVRCAVAVPPGDPARWSRHVVDVIEPLDPWTEPAAYARRLVAWARRQAAPPVLYYGTDGDLLLVSRRRAELESHFRLALPPPELVEDLADKARFAQLADRLNLPVPAAVALRPRDRPAAAAGLRLPLVAKPVTPRGTAALRLAGKAARVASTAELLELCALMDRTGVDVLVQELVAGPETRVESYHAYLGASGVLGEFTGEKLRTHPAEYGESTRLRITDRVDVAELGRSTALALGLVGPCKLDFKRDQGGKLWLLEVNARFNLWHNPGAAAGVNLPALAHAALTGASPPRTRPVRAGVTWAEPLELRRAMAADGGSVAEWARIVATSTTRSTGSWDDPWPLVRGVLLPVARRRALPVRRAA